MTAARAPISAAVSASSTARSSEAVQSGPRPLVDINSAMLSQIRELPGIGDAYSARIVANRPYAKKDRLVSKGVLPQGVYGRTKVDLVARRTK